MRDLWKAPKPQGRTPEAGPSVDVYIGVVVAGQAGQVRFIEPNQVVQGPDLAAVGVVGQDQVHPVACGLQHSPGAVGQEDQRPSR